jgi:hypothetical protein
MRKEYDFSKATRAKFYVPAEEIEIPIYLDKRVKEFYQNAANSKKIHLSKMINSILEKEMEIHKEIVSGK